MNSKLYFRSDSGDEYYDYIWINGPSVDTDDTIFCSSAFYTALRNRLNKIPTIKVPTGSSVYVNPPCSSPIETIRRKYTIKRDFNNADYTIFPTDFPTPRATSKIVYSIAFFPSCRCCVTFNNKMSFNGAVFAIKQGYPNLPVNDLHLVTGYYRLRKSSMTEAMKLFAVNKFTKPFTTINGLDLNSEVEVTADLLQMVYSIGISSRSTDNIKNFVLQLESLYNHNWREYRGSISTLFAIFRSTWCTAYDVLTHTSRYFSKSLKELYSECANAVFVSNKDKMMMQSLVMKILEMKDSMFVSLTSMLEKLTKAKFSPYFFARLFDCTVRITPKIYTDEED